MSRIINFIAGIVLGGILLFLWVIPVAQRRDAITWVCLSATGVCVVAASITQRKWFGTWRGLGTLLATHLAAQAWLQWQWDLWNSPSVLMRNLNTVALLLVFATFVALCASWLWLLVDRDASLPALTLVWIGWQLLLILTALRYHTLDNMDSADMREQIVLIVPTCLLAFLALAGGLAFLAHYVGLLVKEITGREIPEVEHS